MIEFENERIVKRRNYFPLPFLGMQKMEKERNDLKLNFEIDAHKQSMSLMAW